MPLMARTQHTSTVLYTLKEFAHLIGVSERTAWQYVKDERIPAQLIGRKWFISEDNIKAFFNGAKYTQRGYNKGRTRRANRVPPQPYKSTYTTGQYSETTESLLEEAIALTGDESYHDCSF